MIKNLLNDFSTVNCEAMFNAVKKLIDKNIFITNYKILTQPCYKNKDNVYEPIIFYQVERGWITDNKKLLSIKNYEGETVAHRQAQKGWITNDIEVLKWTDDYGSTVAHELAANTDWTTEDPELLKLQNYFTKTSVAHVLAERGWITNNDEILRLTDKYGWSLVHQQVLYKQNYIPPKQYYKLATTSKTDLFIVQYSKEGAYFILRFNAGTTVAHVLAFVGWWIDELEIQKLADVNGWTVAHEMAIHNWVADDQTILSLKGVIPEYYQTTEIFEVDVADVIKAVNEGILKPIIVTKGKYIS